MIEQILLRLKLWSFLFLPLVGFFTGHLLQLCLGTKFNPKYESIVVHLLTVSSMAILFADVSMNSEVIKDIRDRTLFLSISYLFVLFLNLGLISVIY